MGVTFGIPKTVDRWAPVADACRARPGEWATPDFHVRHARSMASLIKAGRLVAFRPAGSFEAKQVAGRLWIRFIG